MKQPKTTNEHIIALYGYIKGLKAAITNIRTNDLKHMHQDIDKLHNKLAVSYTHLTLPRRG